MRLSLSTRQRVLSLCNADLSTRTVRASKGLFKHPPLLDKTLLEVSQAGKKKNNGLHRAVRIFDFFLIFFC